jgi:hypothetical protein
MRYYEAMDYSAFFEKANSDWLLKRAALDKEEIAFVAGKDSFRGRLRGFLTHAYYQRTSLIKTSEIYLAYVFQSWTNDVEQKGDSYPTWLLFSPEKEMNQNPILFKEISAKLLSLKESKEISKDEKELQKYLQEYLSDVSYFELPHSCSLNHFVYLSIVDVPLLRVPNFHLGLNLILANPSVSKEVLYLPEKEWPEDFLKAYSQGETLI